MAPGAHHLQSVVLHALNSVLLLLVLSQMTGSTWRSAFVAALFAVHPMHVESVAWVSERKDVLAAMFWLLTMWAYVRYVRKPGPLRYGRRGVGADDGIAGKTHGRDAAGDPASPRRVAVEARDGVVVRPRPCGVRLIIEKLPLLALATAFLTWTLVAQRGIGAVATLEALPFPARLANASMSLVTYIGKLVWPSGLAVFYPFPRETSIWLPLAGAGFLIAASLARVAFRSPPAAPAGRVALVSGDADSGHRSRAGRQSRDGRSVHVPAGDRSLPHRGVGRPRTAVEDLPVPARRPRRRSGRRDRVRESRHAHRSVTGGRARRCGAERLRSPTDNFRAHAGMAEVRSRQNRIDEAIAHYSEAVRLAPDEAEWHVNLGLLLVQKGEIARAAESFDRAVRLRPAGCRELQQPRRHAGAPGPDYRGDRGIHASAGDQTASTHSLAETSDWRWRRKETCRRASRRVSTPSGSRPTRRRGTTKCRRCCSVSGGSQKPSCT